MTHTNSSPLTNIICIFVLFIISTEIVFANNNFPGRERYPAVPYISIVDLKKKFKNVVIVDVRSKYEFDTLKIKGAINISISSKSFITEMKKLRNKTLKTIVVYCNGKTCMKSYKATQKCRIFNINNVIAYDQGVLDWAKRNPKQSILLGQNPVNPKHIISKKKFKKHLLEPMTFEEQISSKNIIVLDVRDPFQREGLGLFVGIEKRATMDDYEKLNIHIKNAKRNKLPIYIYDETGKQVRWLMYYLEKMKVREYYFMKGGARAFFDVLRNKYVH